MFQQAPQTITVTDLQRNPKIIDYINKKNKEVFILKGSKQIGVYTPLPRYTSQIERLEDLEEELAKGEKQKQLEKDLEWIRRNAGKLKMKLDYTPEQLNEIFEKSYDDKMLSGF